MLFPLHTCTSAHADRTGHSKVIGSTPNIKHLNTPTQSRHRPNARRRCRRHLSRPPTNLSRGTSPYNPAPSLSSVCLSHIKRSTSVHEFHQTACIMSNVVNNTQGGGFNQGRVDAALFITTLSQKTALYDLYLPPTPYETNDGGNYCVHIVRNTPRCPTYRSPSIA